jgi:hypothetical protein
MMDLTLIARIVALFGLVLLVIAGVLYILDRIDLPIGNLPGDFRIKLGDFTCSVPILSSLIISVVLTVIFNLVLYFLKK